MLLVIQRIWAAGSVAIGFGGGFTDDAVKPGRADYGTWGIFSKDGKTIILA